MTTKRVLCRNQDNTFCVCNVALGMPGAKSKLDGETDDEYLLRIAEEDKPNMTGYRIVEDSSLPDRRWRSAWRDDGVNLSVDLPEARNIRLNELKPIRDEKRIIKREDYEIAMANAASTDEILADLKSMNNMETDEPANLDNQATLEDISNYLPLYLQ